MAGLSAWFSFLPSLNRRYSRTRAKEHHTAGGYPGFCSMKQLRVLLLLLDGMLVYHRVTPNSMSPGGERQGGVRLLV